MTFTRRQSIKTVAASGAVLSGVGTSLSEQVSAQVANSTVLPFDKASSATLQTARPRVYAHWHAFPISTDNKNPAEDYYAWELRPGANAAYADVGGYFRSRPLPRPPRPQSDWRVLDAMEDAGRAQAIGVDAFIYNVMSFRNTSIHYINMQAMREGIRRLGNGFKMMPSLDLTNGNSATLDMVLDLVMSFYTDTVTLRKSDGRICLGAFCPESKPIEFWQELDTALANRGVSTNWTFMLVNWGLYSGPYGQFADVLSHCGTTFGDMGMTVQRANQARSIGKTFMQHTWTQDFRPKSRTFVEGAGSLLHRTGWAQAMAAGIDRVVLGSWNDYSEGTEIAPSTASQYAHYDMAAYYTQLFKTGVAPAIRRDVLYYFHRVQPSSPATTTARQPAPFVRRGGYTEKDEIELVGFLTAPGTLEIEVDGTVTRQAVDAGVQSLRAPLGFGVPQFRLTRGGSTVQQVDSAFEIKASADYQDLLYRCGGSSRPQVPMVA